MDQDDQPQGPPAPPVTYSGAADVSPEGPPTFTPAPEGPSSPTGPTDGRPGPVPEGPRPLPLITSLAGAAGAVFLLASLGLFLSELTGDSRRMGGLFVCLLFQGLGVGLMLLTRGRASTTAGVGLTALAVIPLVVYLFVDVDNPDNTFNSTSSFTNTATLILLASAGAWLVAYFFGPGRRYGIYLGGALLALWLVAVVQIVDNPLGYIFNPFQAQTTFEPIGNAVGPDGYYYDDSSNYEDEFYEDDFFSDTSGEDDFFMPSQDDGFGDDFAYEDEYGFGYGEPYGSIDDPSTKLGWTSLLFGGTYLALAAWRDRRRDTRMGTPLVAVAAPILLSSIVFLNRDFGGTGTSMLAIAIGAAQIFVGTRQGRRFTSWIGLLTATFGVVNLVGEAVGDSTKVSAIVLLILGVGVTLLALALDGGLNLDKEGNGRGPEGSGGPGIPPTGDGQATAVASAWAAPATPPTIPQSLPPAAPGPTPSASASANPPWEPPRLEAPPAPPWSSPEPDPASPWAPPGSGEPEPPTPPR
ncbi:MAG: hypothetical protein ABI239_00130 [Aquihabitans sp.]